MPKGIVTKVNNQEQKGKITRTDVVVEGDGYGRQGHGHGHCHDSHDHHHRNHHKNHGKGHKHDDNDDDVNCNKNIYKYNVKNGGTVNGYVPKIGDIVDFQISSSSPQVAVQVELASNGPEIVSFARDASGENLDWNTTNTVKVYIAQFGEFFTQTGSQPIGREEGPFILVAYDAAGNSLDSDPVD